MGFIQIENLLLSEAIKELEKQLIELGERNKPEGTLYLGQGIIFDVIKKGKNVNKLTITQDGEIREDITPVNCYNLYRSMPIAEAVQEYLEWGKNKPEKFFI